MSSPPKPKLTPFQRATGHLGQTNAEFLFSQHHNPQALSTVGDDAWGQVLAQTRARVKKQEDRAAAQADRQQAAQPPPASLPEPTPAPPPPAPAQAAPVPNRPATPTPESGGRPVTTSASSGKSQLRTDRFAQAASTGLQLPR